MGRRSPFFGEDAADAMEHLRKGTRQQYESSWVSVGANTDVPPTVDLTHELGEVPWTVDVLRSDHSEGYGAVECPATDVGVSKTSSLVTLTIPTTVTADYYYQVRAM